MKFELKVLSYIHIGNGQEISKWSYSVDENKVSIYNFDKVVYNLSKNQKALINLTSMIEENRNDRYLGDFIEEYKINVTPEYILEYKGKVFDNKNYKAIKEFIIYKTKGESLYSRK